MEIKKNLVKNKKYYTKFQRELENKEEIKFGSVTKIINEENQLKKKQIKKQKSKREKKDLWKYSE